MKTRRHRIFYGTLALMMATSLLTAGSVFAGDPATAPERLASAMAEQGKLVTTLRAEFHRLKYEKIPHPYAKFLVDVEKIVGQIGSNSATIEHEIIPDLKLHTSISAQSGNSGNPSDDSMTVKELADWIIGHKSAIKKRVQGTVAMFPYLTNLTPMTLEKLAYAVTADPCYEYSSYRNEIIAAGKEFLAKQSK